MVTTVVVITRAGTSRVATRRTPMRRCISR